MVRRRHLERTVETTAQLMMEVPGYCEAAVALAREAWKLQRHHNHRDEAGEACEHCGEGPTEPALIPITDH